MQVPDPTVISSKSYPGVITSPSFGNVAWNADGQCLYVSAKSINILTPHIGTSLPPPVSFLDPDSIEITSHVGTRVVKRSSTIANGEEGGGGEEKPPVASGSTRKVKRPRQGGELSWWTNGLDVDKEKSRGESYGWTEVGDEYNTVILPEEVEVRQAVWSPSGMSDLGRCLLGVMNSQGQVSVYSPGNDPYAKKWVEIADLTILTKQLLPKSSTSPVTSISAMLEMRAVCMAWSSAVPLPAMIGVDGSILALASRAGYVSLWSYGPEAHFKRVAHLKTPKGLINRLAWSPFVQIDQTACGATLSIAMSDGSIHSLQISQKANAGDPSGWSATQGEIQCVDKGDGRSVTALSWIRGLLVWTKPASVHLLNPGQAPQIKWTGLKSIVLDRVGNWAGANAFGPCVGIQEISPYSLLIVLSSLSHHYITHLSTSPTLASPPTSLAYSLSSREVMMDYARVELSATTKGGLQTQAEKNITGHTTGWAGIGNNGDLSTWAFEPTNFHDLDFAADGKRTMGFVSSENGVGDRPDILTGLKELLENPPRLIHTSPLQVLLPHLLRIRLSLPDGEVGRGILDLLSTVAAAPPLPRAIPSRLCEALWHDEPYWEGMRLRMIIAQYCAAIYSDLQADFTQTMRNAAESLKSHVATLFLVWTATHISKGTSLRAKSRDSSFASSLLRQSPSDLPSAYAKGISAVLSAVGTSSGQEGDKCPACGDDVMDDMLAGIDEVKCGNGHSWSRCSITSTLISTPSYRVCTICPAIALLPRRLKEPPIPVSSIGVDKDWKRHEAALKREGPDWIVEEALEAARVCVRCGGRWMRSM